MDIYRLGHTSKYHLLTIALLLIICISIVQTQQSNINAQQALYNNGDFCQSDSDCENSCCYKFQCDIINSCKARDAVAVILKLYIQIPQKRVLLTKSFIVVHHFTYDNSLVESQGCLQSSDCPSQDQCCVSRQCITSEYCDKIFKIPVLIGVFITIPLYLLLYVLAKCYFSRVQNRKKKLMDEREDYQQMSQHQVDFTVINQLPVNDNNDEREDNKSAINDQELNELEEIRENDNQNSYKNSEEYNILKSQLLFEQNIMYNLKQIIHNISQKLCYNHPLQEFLIALISCKLIILLNYRCDIGLLNFNNIESINDFKNGDKNLIIQPKIQSPIEKAKKKKKVLQKLTNQNQVVSSPKIFQNSQQENNKINKNGDHFKQKARTVLQRNQAKTDKNIVNQQVDNAFDILPYDDNKLAQVDNYCQNSQMKVNQLYIKESQKQQNQILKFKQQQPPANINFQQNQVSYNQQQSSPNNNINKQDLYNVIMNSSNQPSIQTISTKKNKKKKNLKKGSNKQATAFDEDFDNNQKGYDQTFTAGQHDKFKGGFGVDSFNFSNQGFEGRVNLLK